MKIAIVGGTGPQGCGLALRWARAGIEVLVGSRDPKRGKEIGNELKESAGDVTGTIAGMGNEEAVEGSDEIVVLAVPYSAHSRTITSLKSRLGGKILLDLVVPLAEKNAKKVEMPKEGSATEEAQVLLGETVSVVGALHNVSAAILADLDRPINCDVLVCGDNRAAKDRVIALIERLEVRVFNAGLAESARAVEAMTAILIRLNISKSYPFKHAGLRIWAEER